MIRFFYTVNVSINAQEPEILFIKHERLVKVKEKILAGDAEAIKWKKGLIKDGDNNLSIYPVSVIAKTQTPPSGNNHDYMSLAPYFWPDSSKPGLIP